MQQTADLMGVTSRTVRQWIADGLVTGYQLNARTIRLDLNEVDAAFKPIGGGAA